MFSRVRLSRQPPHQSSLKTVFRRSSATGRNPGIRSGSTTAVPPAILVADTGSALPTALSQPIQGAIAQLIRRAPAPCRVRLSVSAHSTTQTFAVGPQLAYRHFSHLTLFIRPSLGAIHEEAVHTPPMLRHFHRATNCAIGKKRIGRILRIRRRFRYPFLQARWHTHASRPGVRSPVQRRS